MDRIETTILVEPDGSFHGHLPCGIEPGEHPAVLELDAPAAENGARGPLVLPVLRFEVEPGERQFRREDIYAGRG